MNLTLPTVESLLNSLAQQMRTELPAEPLMIGIHTGGAWIAEALHRQLQFKSKLGTIDISFYRDDFSTAGLHPKVNTSFLPEDVDNRDIILVDDILQTGRTIRAALNEIFSFGRPKSIVLVVLIDRGLRELPIQADYCGAVIDLAPDEHIKLSGPENMSIQILRRD